MLLSDTILCKNNNFPGVALIALLVVDFLVLNYGECKTSTYMQNIAKFVGHRSMFCAAAIENLLK